MSHNEGFAVRRVFSPLFFVRRHSAGLGVKKRRVPSLRGRIFRKLSFSSISEDGKVDLTNRTRSHTLIVPLSAPRRIHNLRLSLLPLPTLSLSNTLKCLFPFDVDDGSHAAAQIRDMMKNTTELRSAGRFTRSAEKCLS